MDWRILPENQVIARDLDAVSASFPFFADFLEAFKKVEEKIQTKYERSSKPTRKDKIEACRTDSEENATEEKTSERRKPQDSSTSDSKKKWKAVDNIESDQASYMCPSGDGDDTIKLFNGFANGSAPEPRPTANELSSDGCKKLSKIEQRIEKTRNGSHSDDQTKTESIPYGSKINGEDEEVSQIIGHLEHNENNSDTESQEGNDDSVLSSEANARSPSQTEFRRDSVISSNSKSEYTVMESDHDHEPAGKENCLDGRTTKGSTGSEGPSTECYDLYGDDDEETDPGYERLDGGKETQDCDDMEDEDITDSDEESSESEKPRLSYLYNYRTMVLSVTGKDLGLASRWNAKVLRHHPTNFIALRNKVRLYMMQTQSLGPTFVSAAFDTLELLKEVAKDHVEMLIAKAEVANIFERRLSNSTTDVLIRSVPLFEEVLEEVDQLPEGTLNNSTFQDLAPFWKRDLTDVYLNLMSSSERVLERHGHTLSSVFLRIKDLLQSVVNDECVAKQIRAQASIELGDALISYLRRSEKEGRKVKPFEDIDVDECFKQARLLNPDDPDIRLRAVRQQRLHAKTTEELEKVIEELTRCVDSLSSRRGDQKDIALHHLGLAYRSLWLQTGRKTTTQLRVYFRSSGLTDADGFSPPVGCLVIKAPGTLLESVLVPQPYKNPPKHILLRDSNPVARSNDPNLLKARNSFKEADSLTADGSGCLYPVEVARTYMSTGETKNAQMYLWRAHQRRIIGENGVYLYEQMGMFEESTLTDDWNFKAYDIHLEKIKSIYREAIRYDTRGTRSAIMAFYRLLAILYGQIQTKNDDLVRQSEYFLLYMTVQQTEKPNDLVKTMTNDDIKIGLMWRLVEMFHKRNGMHDAAAAFTYLSIIATANKLTADVKDVSLTVPEKQALLLETTERVALERTTQPRYVPQAYKWLCYLDDTGKESRPSYSSSFGILIDVEKSAEQDAVGGILRKQLGIESLEIVRTSELQDVHSKEGLEHVLNILEKCLSVVLITKQGSSELNSIVKAFCSGSSCNRGRICQAAFADDDDIELISNVPTWIIDKIIKNKESGVNQACRLLRALFMR